MRGRGTRKSRGKPVFTMFDFVGVAVYHGDDEDFAEGGVVLARQGRKRYQPRRLLALDVDDHIDPNTREWLTVDEDGNLVFPAVHEQLAAQLGLRFEAWLLQQPGLGLGEETWLRMVGQQLRANAGHYSAKGAEFQTENFAFHPFSQLGGLQQALRVFGTHQRLDDLLTSLNQTVLQPQHGDGPDPRPAVGAPPPAPH